MIKFRSSTAALAGALLLAAGTGVWLLVRNPSPLPLPAPEPVSLQAGIRDVSVRRMGTHAQVSVTAEFRQDGQTPVRLEPPLLRLVTSRGAEAVRYLGPLLPEPVLTGPGPSILTLHFWLPLADSAGPLVLETPGARYPVNLP